MLYFCNKLEIKLGRILVVGHGNGYQVERGRKSSVSMTKVVVGIMAAIIHRVRCQSFSQSALVGSHWPSLWQERELFEGGKIRWRAYVLFVGGEQRQRRWRTRSGPKKEEAPRGTAESSLAKFFSLARAATIAAGRKLKPPVRTLFLSIFLDKSSRPH